MDAIEDFARHVAGTGYADIPAGAVRSAKTFLLDTFGVGVAGSRGPWVAELIETQRLAAGGEAARVWVDGARLSAPGAALCNAYQIHNSEFDCVHEAAVVHTLTVLTAAAMAHAERAGDVDGERFLAAAVLGVDVACSLGVASRAGLRFFRPATAGAFAATAAVGKLMGFDTERLVDAFGATLAQLCGTMQAHTEGSIVLGLQVGYNARNALVACDMAARGLVAPRQVLEGPFGYFALFEGAHRLPAVIPELGRTWRITEVAHKPFPSGRATHGIIDGCLGLAREHGFDAGEVAAIVARVPPLVHHLVGRPVKRDMALAYARLCAQYAAARALGQGGLGVADFRPAALADPDTLALAARIRIEVDDNPDPNALTPVSVAIQLGDGRRFERTVEVVYGHPDRPMTPDAQRAKFRANWAEASRPLDPAAGEALMAAVESLETCPDVGRLVDALVWA